MEFNFQKIVMAVAIIIFIIMIILISVILYYNKYDVKFPPTISECPDYWIDQGSNKGGINGVMTQKCVNVKNLGNLSCGKEMDFTTEEWQGSNGLCNKYNWAKSCDLTWDGITNNKDLCN
jgi:hypothetical protein